MATGSRCFALITARGGSKGLPGKNILPCAGKPLVAWTIEAALQVPSITKILCSTDSEEIRDVAVTWGARCPFLRPAHLAQDTSSHWEVLEHALAWMQANEGLTPQDRLLLLQPTSPLRTAHHINEALRLLDRTGADAVVGMRRAQDHPYLAYFQQPDEFLHPFIERSEINVRRQERPAAFVLNGAIYLVRAASLLAEKTLVPHRTIPFLMDDDASLDIDDQEDFLLAEKLLNELHPSTS